MNNNQYEKAQKLKVNKIKILKEIVIWEKELINKSNLAYRQFDINGRCCKLETNIADAIFDGFRLACINSLRIKLAEIEIQFAAL